MEDGTHGQIGVHVLLVVDPEPGYERENVTTLNLRVVARNAKVQVSKLVTAHHSLVQVNYPCNSNSNTSNNQINGTSPHNGHTSPSNRWSKK